MKKCAICPGLIDAEEEQVLFYLKEGDRRKRRAHLKCYVFNKFKMVSDRACFPSDYIIFNPDGFCNWCRQPALIVESPRGGQAICLSCLDKVRQLYLQGIEANRSTVDSFNK